MNNFYLKFYLLIFGILLFVGGILFLLLNHVDTLYKYVPAEAENYLHIQPKALNQLSDGQRSDIYRWLQDHSSVNELAWTKILESTQREIGLFTLNGQVFGITNNNKKFKEMLVIQHVSSSFNKNVILFPYLELKQPQIETLADQNWFKDVRQRICFKDFILYSQNLSALQLNMPTIKNAELPVMSFLGNFDDGIIRIETLGNIGQTKSSPIDEPLKTLPAQTLSYFRNLRVEEIAQFNAVSDNLELSIIKKLDGGVEYYKDAYGSQIKIAKTALTIDQLKKAILSSLAQIYPSKKERILPDGSVAINLIADENAWNFVEVSPQHWLLPRTNSSDETEIILSLKETTDTLTLTFNAPDFAGIIDSKCSLPKFSQKGVIFTHTSNQNFKTILILNKNQKKVSICID